MKQWITAFAVAWALVVGGFSTAQAADWYYINADADDSTWFIDNETVEKTDRTAHISVKVNNVEGYTYVYDVDIDRANNLWTENSVKVSTTAGIPLFVNPERQEPVEIKKGSIGELIKQAIWGKDA
ncbi:hypothetical protein [Veillonella agrestimuris]|uniref:hypothetical protein n=1 Tax=Veillonella agrestimuris TaxID=2941340 RepID=UPI00203B13A5|nr:hypothetical protein [Veillonella agrestimuris]